MKMKAYFMIFIYCNNFMQLLLSSDISISSENISELIMQPTDTGYTIKPYGRRMSLTKAFESGHGQKQTTLVTNYASSHEPRVEKSGAAINSGINTHRLYNLPQENNKHVLNRYSDMKLFSRDVPVKSQNNVNRRRLSSKSSCNFSMNRVRQRCLRKIRRIKMKIPLNDMNKKTSFAPLKNDFIMDSPELSKHILSSLNVTSSAVDFKPIQAVSVDSVSDQTNSKESPCTCYWKPDSCGCDCIGSMQYDDFQSISKGFFPCRNFTFTMTEGQHYAIPPNFFSSIKRIEVFTLTISNSTFEYICDPTPMTSPFKGVMFSISALIKLKNVSVRRGWNWKPFEQLQSSSGGQVNIIFEDCKLKRLTSDFSNLAKGQVNTLDISQSNLEMVGSNAFGTFVNMTSFRVPSNKIKDLRRTDFPDVLPKLVEIDIRNNQLQILEDDLFKNMPNLKQISLSGNPLIVLSERTFHDVIGQAHLDGLSDIPLYCDCRLQWLKDSKLSKNAVMKRNIGGAICRRPSYLRGIPFEYLSKEHLRCL